MAWQVYRTHSLLCKTVHLFPGPYPGVRRSHRREQGPRQLGTVACQGKALTIEAQTSTEVVFSVEVPCHPCDPTSLRAEKRTAHVDSTRRGKAPPLAILSPISHRGEIGPSGASPAGAQVCTCVIEMGQSLNKKGGRTFHRLFHLSYVAYWLRPILNRSLPWLSTATVRGRFSTSMRLTDSQPSSSKAMTWAVLMHLAMRAPAPPTAAK